MSHAVNHVLLTRFNLPSPGAESFIRAREHWLRDRVALFERYCLPSVQSQTVDNLHWIVYLDPQSPEWLKARLSELAPTGRFTPIYREEVPRPALQADLRSVVGTVADRLVTTNLDNDDGLAADFSERVQSMAMGSSRRVIYVDSGLIVHRGAVYLRRDPRNAFCSVAEPWDSPSSCWAAWHNELDRMMPVAHLPGEPGWLQVIHGDNVSNRVRGCLVSPGRYRATFAGLIDDVPKPKHLAVLADTLLRVPTRLARDSGRAAARRVLLTIGGKAMLDAVHGRWNSARARLIRTD